MPARRFELYALVGASAASLLGNVIAVVAIPWFVLATTGSSAKTGLAACVTALPLALGAAFGGAIVDRVGAKRASVVGDVVAAVAVGAIPLLHTLGALDLNILLALAFLSGIFDAPAQAARLALVPEVAARTEFSLERANSLVTAAEHVGYVLGAPLAGVLIATIGTPATVWFDAGSFVLSALVVAAAVVPAAPHGRARRYVDDLADGIRFVLREPVVRLLITLVVVGTFLISPLAAVLLPVLARREFGGASSYGVMMAAYGGGGLLGTGLYALVGRRIPRRGSFLGFWIAYPPVTALLVLMPPYPLVLAVLAVIGIGVGANVPLRQTVIQERTPAELRGRVFAVLAAAQTAVVPPGVLLGGAVIEAGGLRAALALYAAGNVLLGLLAVLAPAGRRLSPSRRARAGSRRSARAAASSPRSR